MAPQYATEQAVTTYELGACDLMHQRIKKNKKSNVC